CTRISLATRVSLDVW
nr:immunoglobulin heavy chain junction region [Macaca mulatta]MOV88928.1 immunoglobulin heavy chain junction region [Macaca mulatta]MOV90905.1 immunoglobulin heavy chain junction region [Macaca mulatta]MOV91800.1 immunoglobulin heavy chain junction region [Macaca mulatta]